MDIKKPQLVKVEAFVNFFNGSFATPSYNKLMIYFAALQKENVSQNF